MLNKMTVKNKIYFSIIFTLLIPSYANAVYPGQCTAVINTCVYAPQYINTGSYGYNSVSGIHIDTETGEVTIDIGYTGIGESYYKSQRCSINIYYLDDNGVYYAHDGIGLSNLFLSFDPVSIPYDYRSIGEFQLAGCPDDPCQKAHDAFIAECGDETDSKRDPDICTGYCPPDIPGNQGPPDQCSF